MEKEPAVLERSQESPPKPILDPESQQDALEEIEKVERVYRKIDLRIIPAIRSNVGLAQTMNEKQHHTLADELNLKPHQVSTGLSLFYVCYVIFDLPSNLIMTRLSPRVWMSRIVIGVGVLGACMAAMKAAWSF
ncbi:MAG: hypothetical protein OHK93_000681 [Ramalina farinacea]|uniref:Uncharacterized protein n=1 Tax=Ramalina farinacea TaxID=258253 RepID=A0AA43QIX5_9LECA|nr:hypothetical protein [Ramalina farinacea]